MTHYSERTRIMDAQKKCDVDDRVVIREDGSTSYFTMHSLWVDNDGTIKDQKTAEAFVRKHMHLFLPKYIELAVYSRDNEKYRIKMPTSDLCKAVYRYRKKLEALE